MSKTVKGFIAFFLMILFGLACEQTTVTPQIPITEEVVVTATPETQALMPVYNQPDLMIVVDNSYSMVNTDLPVSCDSAEPGKRIRYLIADFIVRIVGDMKEKNVVSKNQKTTLLIMDRNGFVFFTDNPDNVVFGTNSTIKPHDELMRRLNMSKAEDEGDKRNFHGLPLVFDESVMLNVSPNTTIIFITDGDFRDKRVQNRDWSESAQKVVNGVSHLGSTHMAQIHFLLLCDYRLSDSDLVNGDDNQIFEKWNEVSKIFNTHVYHLENPDLSGDLNQGQWRSLKEMMENIFQSTGYSPVEVKGYTPSLSMSDGSLALLDISTKKEDFYRGWSMINGDEHLYIPGNVIQISAGVIPFNNSENATIVLDQQTPVNGFAEFDLSPSHTFSSPECGKHSLNIDKGGYKLYWWQAVIPRFTVMTGYEESSPQYFYNGKESSIKLNAFVEQIDGNLKLINDFDWYSWRSCLQFYLDGNVLDKGDDGLIIKMPISDNGFKTTSIDIEWNGNNEKGQPETIALQKIEFSYVSTLLPVLVLKSDSNYFIPSLGTNGEPGIILDYEGFHPEIADNQNPVIEFRTSSGAMCDLSKLYSPGAPNDYGIIFSRTAKGYSIVFPFNNQYDYTSCTEMILSWPTWSGTRLPAELKCELFWNGKFLEKAVCNEDKETKQ